MVNKERLIVFSSRKFRHYENRVSYRQCKRVNIRRERDESWRDTSPLILLSNIYFFNLSHNILFNIYLSNASRPKAQQFFITRVHGIV